MIVMGIDPSLTSTGIIVLHDGQIETAVTTKNRPELGTIERVGEIRRGINQIISNMTNFYKPEESQAPDLIVIEGFSYGSKGRSVFDIAYLGWRIREELERLKNTDSIPWIEVPPSQLKQFATGKGNANKEIILQQVYKRWGVEFSDNNQADAYVLAKIGEAFLSDDITHLTAIQQRVILDLEAKQQEKGEKPAKKPRKKVEK